jgi:pimeloyl-ACP methyl ester carboxylesterase
VTSIPEMTVTASAVATSPRPAALRARFAAAVRTRTAEALVFSGAAAVALLHAFDDAFLFPRGGVPLTQHAVAFTFGALAAVNGGRHAHHIITEGGTTGHDVTGVLALVAGVEPGRIGALGLSTGADIAIDIAARRDDVKAVVADGSAAIGYQDIKEYTDDPLTRAPMAVLFKAIEVIQGRSGPKASLADQIARSTAPHLIISAGKPEKEWGELYDKAGGAHSELWYLPKAGHTAALKQYPEAYEQRVVSFFEKNL